VGHPDLNKQGVPNVYNMTTNDEDKATLDVFFSQMIFGRPYVLPPETPAERVAQLRKAFAAALADPELLSEAKRANLEVNPVSGEEVEALIKKVYSAEPHIIKRIKTALGAQK
jgi:tripartite-type tricarboxylate transporter receptor subunit TctC